MPRALDVEKMRADIRSIFDAGLAAVKPDRAVAERVQRRGETLLIGGRSYDLTTLRRILVVGAGKASAPMAAAVEAICGDRISAGLVNVKYGHAVPTRTIRVQEAGHPVPDRAGREGAAGMMKLLSETTGTDLVMCVLSGGGSALLPLPVPGIGLEEMQELTRALLESGATIEEINIVRKHLSRIAGGQLARQAHPAAVVCLILSDVVGDRLDAIASGPTVADPTTYADALGVIRRYGIETRVPPSVMGHLHRGRDGQEQETPKPGDPIFERTQNVVVASNRLALTSAAAEAQRRAYHTVRLTSFLQGESREAARVLVSVAREVRFSGQPIAAPACLVAGGETTVTVRGPGLGGRNQEFALSAARELAGMERMVVLAAGTDGTDGPTDAAGAVCDGATLQRGQELGMQVDEYLQANNAYRFFARLDDLIVTGPTRTNVMDLYLLLVG